MLYFFLVFMYIIFIKTVKVVSSKANQHESFKYTSLSFT